MPYILHTVLKIGGLPCLIAAQTENGKVSIRSRRGGGGSGGGCGLHKVISSIDMT